MAGDDAGGETDCAILLSYNRLVLFSIGQTLLPAQSEFELNVEKAK